MRNQGDSFYAESYIEIEIRFSMCVICRSEVPSIPIFVMPAIGDSSVPRPGFLGSGM